MKDDPDFNISFVALIQANSCIYDHTCAEYSNRNVQEKAWERISKELKHSVSDCKERWKNLRGSYTRHLKYSYTPSGSARKKKRPYYLAEYMTFLEPFTKSRQSRGNLITQSDSCRITEHTDNDFEVNDHESINNDDKIPDDQWEGDTQPESPAPSSTNSCQIQCDTQDNNSFGTLTDSVQCMSTPTVKTNRKRQNTTSLEDVNKCAIQYFQNKNACVKNMHLQNASKTEQKDEDPDALFLMSVLPDMKKMNDRQKRRFKIAILSTAGEILEENITNSTFQPINMGCNKIINVGNSAPDIVEMQNVTEVSNIEHLSDFLRFDLTK